MRKVLVPVLAMVAVAASSLMLASPTPSVADPGGCANPHASKGAEKANPHSAHGPDKQSDRDCGGAIPPAQTPTPAPTPTASPSPTPTPAATPTPTPSPTPLAGPQADVKAVGVTVGAPSTAGAGQAFQVSAGVFTHNNGPTATAMVDVTFVLALPADCTATSSTTVTVLNRSLPMSSPVLVSRVWNVTCFQPGSHQFTVTGSLSPSAGQTFTDPNPANNSGSGSASTEVN